MKIIPQLYASFKCWRIFNRIVFGKQKSKQPQIIIIRAIKAYTNHIRLEIIPNREQEVSGGFTERNVEKGSRVVTDRWPGCADLGYLGYDHYSFNHSRGKFAHTNQIESLWAEVKGHMRRFSNNILTSKIESTLMSGRLDITSQSYLKTLKSFYREHFRGSYSRLVEWAEF